MEILWPKYQRLINACLGPTSASLRSSWRQELTEDWRCLAVLQVGGRVYLWLIDELTLIWAPQVITNQLSGTTLAVWVNVCWLCTLGRIWLLIDGVWSNVRSCSNMSASYNLHLNWYWSARNEQEVGIIVTMDAVKFLNREQVYLMIRFIHFTMCTRTDTNQLDQSVWPFKLVIINCCAKRQQNART